ncbi:MAG: efflux RND transporter permease subunit [Bacteroidales bacterium]|nr:efflux RND transporter permease subunit [Bacteroidales bacterium]
MKKLTAFAINFPVTISMIVLGIVLLGGISYKKLGVDLFPDLNNPRIFVEIKAGERPPEEMEKQYVGNIESIAIRQKGVVQVSSICMVGSAQINVEYSWDTDMDEAFLDLQKNLSSFGQGQEIEEMNITQHDPNTAPVMLIGLTHERISDMNELRKVGENYIRNELVRLEGIADVKLSGQEESEIQISTNNYKLKAFNLSLNDISGQIQNYNRNVSGGTVSEMGLQYVVKGVSILNEVKDFQNIIVGYRSVEQTDPATGTSNIGKAPVFLKDVAEIEMVNQKPVNIVRLNGQRCIGLSIYKETRFNTVKAVRQISESLEDIEKALPGYHLNIVANQGNFIISAIKEVEQTALIGIVIAIFVLFIFLRRFGTTLIISLAIPISIIATFNMMYFADLTLNIMTLGGLALGAGMLVDNAIVVMENIFRNHESGLSVKEAAIKGASEVSGAIIASTITTIVVFLPIVYLHGASGELFKDEAWTVAFSLLSSLLIAIFLIPMLYHLVFKNRLSPPFGKSVKFTAYGKFLKKALKYKLFVILGAALLIGTAVLIFPKVGTEFMPKADVREFDVEINLPEGTRLERTESTIANMELVLQDLLEGQEYELYSHIGPETILTGDEQAIFTNENSGYMKIKLGENAKYTSNHLIETIDKVFADIPGLEINYIQDEMALRSILGTEEAPIIVEISGDDLKVIEQLTREVSDKIMLLPHIFNVQTSIEDGSPEIDVIIDRMRAGMFNLSVASVTEKIRNKLEGASAGKMEDGGEMRDITVRLPEKDLSSFMNMTISNGEQIIRLDEIASIETSIAPRKIIRRNQVRIGKVFAQMEKGVALNKISEEIVEKLAEISLPANYRIQVTGEEKKRKDSVNNLSFALLLSIVLVYMVLSSQFESLIHPFTILLTIPLAVVGTILLFFFLGKPISVMAIIGIIILVGIAVNDSIILVDRINQLRKEGVDRADAIVKAVQQRIRPILMTSLTTIIALLPLSIGVGESASLRSPMALAVIGGLVTSTLLTLLVIPCLYDLLDRLRRNRSVETNG